MIDSASRCRWVRSGLAKQPVCCQLADNSEVKCREIAFVDFSIATEGSPIHLHAVPLFILPGPKVDILEFVADKFEKEYA